jgi:hypothetical protein
VIATLLHPRSRDRDDDCCQRAEAGRGTCGLHACLVVGAVGPSRPLCGSAWWDGTAGIDRLFDRFLRHLSDRGDRELGFLAPVLAKQFPAMLDSISQYSRVVIINGAAAILFMIGYVLFGVAMIRTSTLPRWSGWTGRGRRSGPFAWFRHRSAVATRCVSWSTPFGPARAPVSVRAVSPGKMAHSAVSARRVSCRGAEG